MHKPEPAVTWNVALFQADMELKGWLRIDLARATKPRLSHMTINRFFSGERQTARTAKAIADALGKPLKRYVLESEALSA